MNPYAHQIATYPWQWFGTLTWRVVPRPLRRRKLWFAYLYKIAARGDQTQRSMSWVLRQEHGELGHRHHLHFLLGSLKLSVDRTTAFTLMHLWGQLGGGIARLTAYDPSLTGAEYVTKSLGSGQAAGNLYELGKFQGEQLEMSHHLQAWLERRARGICDSTPVKGGPRDSGQAGASGYAGR